MLAFITNLTLSEMAIVVVVAVLVFGKDLPSVVMRGLQQLAKLRKAVREMWTEAGLEQEMRRVRAELDDPDLDLSGTKKMFVDGKNTIEKPLQAWRKSIETEVEGIVSVDLKGKGGPPAVIAEDTNPTPDPKTNGDHQTGPSPPSS